MRLIERSKSVPLLYETDARDTLILYFRNCGWISEREIGRSGDNIATVMPYCRKMMEAIERIFNRDNRAALTNHIFSIYDILSSAYIADHGRTHGPYSNILVPVADNVADLKNELLILKDSIRSIMRVVIKMTETNELGQFLIRDEMLEKFFNDYFFWSPHLLLEIKMRNFMPLFHENQTGRISRIISA